MHTAGTLIKAADEDVAEYRYALLESYLLFPQLKPLSLASKSSDPEQTSSYVPYPPLTVKFTFSCQSARQKLVEVPGAFPPSSPTVDKLPQPRQASS